MTIQVTSHQRLGPGQTWTINDLIGVNIQPSANPLTSWNFNNAGTIIVDVSMPYIVVGMNYDFGSFHQDAVFTNEATGIFRVISRAGVNPTFGLAGGHYGSGWNGDLVNAGLFEVTSPDYAAGIFTYDMTFSLQNSGVLRVTSSNDFAIGSWAANGGTYANTGQIEVQGESAYGLVLEKSGTITNAGSIRVSTTGPEAAVGVVVRHTSHEIIRIENSGLIDAAIAIQDQSYLYSPIQHARQEVLNDGIIRGRVDLKYGDDDLINRGSIEGRIDLGAGDDLYDGVGGSITDNVWGGAGSDRLFGGAQRDVLIGNDGDDDLRGGGGDDVLASGRGADSVDGGEGTDVLTFGDLTLGAEVDLHAGTIVAAGTGTVANVEYAVGSVWNDVLRGDVLANQFFGASGNDRLEGRGGDDLLSGGEGDDILTGGEGADVFVVDAGGGHDIITDFTAGVDRLQVHGHAAWQEIRQDGADLVVVLSDAASIRFTGVTVAALQASSPVFVPTPAPVLQVPDFGRSLNRSESMIVALDDLIVEGETLYFRNVSTAVLVGQNFVEGSLRFVNDGTVDIAGSPENAALVGVGIFGADSGTTVSNGLSGRIVVHASGASVSAYGLHNSAISARAENLGAIEVTGESDATGIGFSNYAFARVLNAGTLRVESGEDARGIVAGSWATVSNSGLIEVSGATSATGIVTSSNTPELVNSGVIRVTSEGEAVGVHAMFGWLKLNNSGVIEAATAIRSNIYDDRIDNTGSIIGTVSLGSGADVVANHGLITGLISLGDGADRYEGALSNHAANVNGEAGDDRLYGGQAGDTLKGGAGIDLLDGGKGGDTLDGGEGDDRLYGGDGNDILYGDVGDDLLEGGAGNDVLIANIGNDTLRGGTGTDTVYVSGGSMHYRLLADGDDFILKGRDGSDRLTGVEFVRFDSGEVWDLARLYEDGREVLPGLPGSKDEPGEPLILPGTGEEPGTAWTPRLELDIRPGLLLRLEAAGMDFDPDARWSLTVPEHSDWG